VTSPRGPVSPRPATGVWKTPVSNVGDSLLVQDFASGSGHVTTLPCSGDYQSWLDVDASSAVGRGGGGGILQGRRRTAGRPGRSTVTFLSPVRDGRPGPSGGLGAALDDRPYAATLKAERCTAAVPMTVTACFHVIRVLRSRPVSTSSVSSVHGLFPRHPCPPFTACFHVIRVMRQRMTATACFHAIRVLRSRPVSTSSVSCVKG